MSPPCAAILDAEGLRLSAEETAFFRDANPWGFIVFARNIDTPEQLRALTTEMREAVGRNAPVLIDQEGGRVQRMRGPHWREWLPPLDEVARAGANAEKMMHLRYALIAAELRGVGIDVNCAPMLDVATDETHPFLRNRCYSDDPGAVARIGRAVADGLLAGGVLPVVKHLPGHGRATLDSHKALPRISADLKTLEAVDFAPFKALNDMPLGMTAHIVLEALTDGPATTTPEAMTLIRERIGFDGLIMSDDLSMEALSGTPAERAAAAIAAGCDLALYCNGPLRHRRAVAEAAGPLSEDARDRADRALDLRHAPADVDIAALAAEFEALTTGQGNG